MAPGHWAVLCPLGECQYFVKPQNCHGICIPSAVNAFCTRHERVLCSFGSHFAVLLVSTPNVISFSLSLRTCLPSFEAQAALGCREWVSNLWRRLDLCCHTVCTPYTWAKGLLQHPCTVEHVILTSRYCACSICTSLGTCSHVYRHVGLCLWSCDTHYCLFTVEHACMHKHYTRRSVQMLLNYDRL